MVEVTPMEGEPEKFDEVHRRRKSRKRRRFRGVAAPYVFFFLAFLGVASIGAVYVLDTPFLPFAGAVIVLILYGLYVNDTKGFVRKRQMRRAYEARRNFNNWEVATLIVLIMGNVMVSLLAFLT